MLIGVTVLPFHTTTVPSFFKATPRVPKLTPTALATLLNPLISLVVLAFPPHFKTVPFVLTAIAYPLPATT
ncbi:hypothetical protein D3C74_314670 [compost metagenome]